MEYRGILVEKWKHFQICISRYRECNNGDLYGLHPVTVPVNNLLGLVQWFDGAQIQGSKLPVQD